jgi:hypothetical protein
MSVHVSPVTTAMYTVSSILRNVTESNNIFCYVYSSTPKHALGSVDIQLDKEWVVIGARRGGANLPLARDN